MYETEVEDDGNESVGSEGVEVVDRGVERGVGVKYTSSLWQGPLDQRALGSFKRICCC